MDASTFRVRRPGTAGWAAAISISCILAGGTVPATAADAGAGGLEFFEKRIRPVLAAKCYKCHSADARSLKGGLFLDTRDGIRSGGDSGHAVVPGSLEESLLIQAVRYGDKDRRMPPGGKLPDQVIADLEKWVAMGAPDPRDGLDGATSLPRAAPDLGAAREFWAFQQPRRTEPPAVKDAAWPRGAIDRFVLARLEAAGLRPAPDAGRRDLFRRAWLDLTGLPPSFEEAEAVAGDEAPDAFAALVDRLLASPLFGERWGRHWLDVARYAESSGKERNLPYPYAWRYRDYVIDAFNADKPYDRFIREQIAGDLLPAASDAECNEHLVATGFLAIGTRSLNTRNPRQYAMDVADEQLDATTCAFLALTVSCARCHDHKFDPIPTADYYALAGIFCSTETLAGVRPGNNRNGYGGSLQPLAGSMAPEAALTAAESEEVRRLEAAIGEARAKARAELRSGRAPGRKAAGKALQPRAAAAEAARLRARLDELRLKSLASADVAMAARDADRPADCRIHIRGEVGDLGPAVRRGFPAVLAWEGCPQVPAGESGRRELAQWLSSPRNPLTARVMANRIWHHLFGAGMVRTVDNFGLLGERPSHPELLDYLALRFIESGWSVKSLVREIMLSRTYQLGSGHDPLGHDADPENRLLWRMSRRRLSAEAIRDGILAASGRLDLRRPHASVVLELPTEELGRRRNAAAMGKASYHRSVYLPILRGFLPEALEVFDAADPELVVGQRDVTTVAAQALFLLNSPFVAEASERTARRLLEARDLQDAAGAGLAYRLILGREATAAEKSRALEHVAGSKRAAAESSGNGLEADLLAWSSLCQALFASAEFRYVY